MEYEGFDPLSQIRKNLMVLSQDPWQTLWENPTPSTLYPPTSCQENITNFLRLFPLNKNDLNILKDKDLKEASQRFKEIFDSNLPLPADFNLLSLANQHKNTISAWLANDQPENIKNTLTKMHLLAEKITANDILLEKPDEFSQALISDLALINKESQENNQFLLFNLRRQLSQALLGKSADQELAKIIEKNPHLYSLVLALEKLYLNQFVLNLKLADDELKDEKAQERDEKEGQYFNLVIDDQPANQTLVDLKKKNHQEAEEVLKEKTVETVIKLGLCYYLNLWSKTWSNDPEYVLSFPQEMYYLINARLPLKNNQLIIPDTHLSKKTINDLVKNKKTSCFISHHLPTFRIFLTAQANRQGLFFFLGDIPIGHFSSENFSSS